MPVALAKLTPPRVGRVVPRERLYRSLDAALDASAVWVGAPAGSGKTTAIADYLTRRKTPLVWYRVDAGDLDLAAFFHSFAQSLSARQRMIGSWRAMWSVSIVGKAATPSRA